MFARLYVRVGSLITRGKHLHVRIPSLREKVWIHKTSLIPPLFIEIVSIKPEMWAVMHLWAMGTSIDFWLFPSFLYWILEMFQQCDIIYFSFYVNLFIDSISEFKGHSSKEDDKKMGMYISSCKCNYWLIPYLFIIKWASGKYFIYVHE